MKLSSISTAALLATFLWLSLCDDVMADKEPVTNNIRSHPYYAGSSSANTATAERSSQRSLRARSSNNHRHQQQQRQVKDEERMRDEELPSTLRLVYSPSGCYNNPELAKGKPIQHYDGTFCMEAANYQPDIIAATNKPVYIVIRLKDGANKVLFQNLVSPSETLSLDFWPSADEQHESSTMFSVMIFASSDQTKIIQTVQFSSRWSSHHDGDGNESNLEILPQTIGSITVLQSTNVGAEAATVERKFASDSASSSTEQDR